MINAHHYTSQMKICQVDYADFVVWKEENLYVQKITICEEENAARVCRKW